MNKELIKKNIINAVRIRKMVYEIFQKHNVDVSLCANEPNPYYDQVSEESGGIICEYYYGIPHHIYTPLGYINLSSSMLIDANAENAIAEIEDVFGFKIAREGYKSSMGYHGPWYYITKLPWEAEELPQDVIYIKNCNSYVPYDEAKEIYREIIQEIEGENIC